MIPAASQIDIEEAIANKPAVPFENWPEGEFGCIAADPAWRYLTWSDKGKDRSADRHYPTMSFDEIKALPVGDLAHKDCVLLLWVIQPMLPHAFDVIRCWGFTYSTIGFCWVKTTRRTQASWAPKWHFGMGHWSRANVELCLLAKRGKPKRLSAGVSQLIIAPVREHSRKPDEFYPRAQRLCGGPYLDLFSRENREGWSVGGNEIGKFDEARL